MKSKNWRDPHIKIFNFKLTPYIGVGKSLFLWFLVISIVPLLTVSYINYINAFEGLVIVAEKTLVNSSRLRENNLNSYFADIEKNLKLHSGLKSNKTYLRSLTKDYSKYPGSLDDYVQSDEYKNLKQKRQHFFKRVRALNGYYEIYLIDMNGNVLYSVDHNKMLGTNIFDGPYAGTKIGETSQKILETGQLLFSDFEKDKYKKDLISGIVGKTLHDEKGDILGMIAFRIRDNDLNQLMQKGKDLGETGVAYIVGEDLLMRSLSRSGNDTAILKEEVRNEKTLEWLNTYRYLPAREDGFKEGKRDIISSYKGIYGEWVYGIARNIEKLQAFGVNWAIVEEFERDEAFANTKQLARTVKISLIITGIVVMIISLFITSRTVTPIKELSAWAKQVAEGHLEKKNIRAPKNEVGEMKDTFNNLVDYIRGLSHVTQDIAKGDFSKKVDVRSEHDVLAKSVNQMIESFRSVVNQANRIAKGDYSAEVKPRGDKDTLGVALENMTRELRESSKEIKRQDWMKTGLSELNARMSGKKELNELSREIIEFMAVYLNAGVGLIYVKEEDKLVLQESYALKDKQGQFKEVKMGEGLVGQAAQSSQMLEITKTYEEAVPSIDMTVAAEEPASFLVAPFLYENNLIGVVQIGTQKMFSDLEKQLFQSAMDSIAVAVNAALAHSQLQKLLKKSQHQQEKLEVQQEELRQTNEELEEQTKALKASENTLQQQKEELSVINEELEERTKALEKEKDKIKVKNDELETARKQIEEKAHDLEKASKYKSEFLANMSHELRTPLNSILVLSQLLMRNDQGNLSEKQIEFAKTINTSGNDLLELINDILDLSKVESGKLQLNIEKVELQEVADNIEGIFTPVTNKKNLDLYVEVDEALPKFITSDPQRVMQIIKNLMSNAVKFTEKGYVKLHIFPKEPDESLASSEMRKQGAVGFSVIDTGNGIPREKREMIFEAFQQADGTTSRKYGGTGLGLSISRSFTELLKGEIQLDSEEGKGTTFTLYVPLELEDPTQKEKKTADKEQEKVEPGHSAGEDNKAGEKVKESGDDSVEDKPSRNEQPKKEKVAESEKDDEKQQEGVISDDRNIIKSDDRFILIIEDDPKFAKTLYDMAGEWGFKAMVAKDGETGIHYADYYSPGAIILDVMLPGIDGWEVMTRLKNSTRTRHIPVHFISATDKSMRAMKMGAIGYLTKPVSVEKLEKVFKKIEDVLFRQEKRVLVVDDESIVRKSVEGLIGKEGISIKSVGKGHDAFEMLKEEVFDLVILDLGLEDMSGLDLLEMIKKEKQIGYIPVIVYTGQELSREEEQALKKYAESIIIKGARSPERLLAETTLFLHKSEKELPEGKKELLHNYIQDKGDVLKGKKVLAVDDDMRNLFALSSVLGNYGLTVEMAKNGREVLEKLKQDNSYDAVLMDIMMPEMDGYEAIRRIRKMPQYESLPIIALTAKAMKNDREKCLAAGASEYLSKPVDNEKLLSMLRVWLYNNK